MTRAVLSKTFRSNMMYVGGGALDAPRIHTVTHIGAARDVVGAVPYELYAKSLFTSYLCFQIPYVTVCFVEILGLPVSVPYKDSIIAPTNI